ncbi:MAG: PAS domain-containing protein [Herminiimonas sp.]|nr:PAS domain-containing protein [Herminiimonas sp.]
MKHVWPSMLQQPRETFWRTLTTFSATRILIALVLLVYLSFNSRNPFGDVGQQAYWETCIAYLGLALCFIVLAGKVRQRFLLQLTVQITCDIGVVSILYIIGGGGRSGLAILYLFPLAGSAILAPLVLAFFFVAVVTLVLLSESAYALLQMSNEASVSQAGLYGAAFFVAVFAINQLASRLIKQEELAAERGIELDLQEAINRLVIADTGDGILVVAADGTVLTGNPAAERMLGLDLPHQMRGLVLTAHATLAPIANAWLAWAGRAEGPGQATEPAASTFVLVKPAVANVAASAQQSWAGRRELKAHLKLRFARACVGQTPQDRTIIFMQDVSEIDNQAQQLKLASMGRLTASIAHEVRNPLSAISYSAALLLEESRDPAQVRLLTIVSENVTRLNRMIEDILRLSRKANRPDEPLLLAPTIAAILAEFIETHAIAEELVRIAPIGDHRVWFDGMHLQEVLLNLLSNALRYASGRAGSIRLDIVPVSRGRIELHVQDDGASISPQVRAHLFEPFYTTSSKGTGLGLYLARELCLNNGAVLDYEYRTDVADILAVSNGTDPAGGSGGGEPSGRFVITFATAAPA